MRCTTQGAYPDVTREYPAQIVKKNNNAHCTIVLRFEQAALQSAGVPPTGKLGKALCLPGAQRGRTFRGTFEEMTSRHRSGLIDVMT